MWRNKGSTSWVLVAPESFHTKGHLLAQVALKKHDITKDTVCANAFQQLIFFFSYSAQQAVLKYMTLDFAAEKPEIYTFITVLMATGVLSWSKSHWEH